MYVVKSLLLLMGDLFVRDAEKETIHDKGKINKKEKKIKI